MFEIDYSKGDSFEKVNPGEYEVTVINYEMKKAKTSGNNMIVVDYEIRSDYEQPCQGQKILFDNFVVSEKTMWRFQQASKAAGMPDGKKYKSYKEWADEFVNRPLRLVIVDGPPNDSGKVYPEVKSFKESKAAKPADNSINISDEDIPF